MILRRDWRDNLKLSIIKQILEEGGWSAVRLTKKRTKYRAEYIYREKIDIKYYRKMHFDLFVNCEIIPIHPIFNEYEFKVSHKTVFNKEICFITNDEELFNKIKRGELK